MKLLFRSIYPVMLCLLVLLTGCSSESTAPDYSGIIDVPPSDVPMDVTTVYKPGQPLPDVTINISLPESTVLMFEIQNVMGHVVRTLVAEGSYPAGTVELTWDGTNDSGKQVKSGLYIYHLRADQIEAWRVSPICFNAADCEGWYDM
jgi:hypothetical protein